MEKNIVCLLLLFLFVPVYFSNGCDSSKPVFGSSPRPLARKQEEMQFSPQVTRIPASGIQQKVTLWKNIPFVEVYINSKGPFLFAVDTGVTGLMISNPLVRRLGLKVSSKRIDIILGTPRGKTNLGRPLEVRKIGIGDAVFFDIEAARIPPSALEKYDIKFDGILGLGVFRDCVVELNYLKKHLKLIASENCSELISEGAIPAVFTKKHVTIKGKLDEKVLVFQLDTGSAFGISLARKHKAGLKFKNGEKKLVLGSLNGTQEVTKSTLDGNAVFGHLLLKEPAIYIYTKNLLGAEVLKNCILKFSQNHNYVSITQE